MRLDKLCMCGVGCGLHEVNCFVKVVSVGLSQGQHVCAGVKTWEKHITLRGFVTKYIHIQLRPPFMYYM